MMWRGIAPSILTSLGPSMSTEVAPTQLGSPSLLTTETPNPQTTDIDTLTTLEMVQRINQEDAKVAAAVGSQSVAIAQAIDAIAARMRRGGRLIYVGAGTSGRLGVLDAAECPPTFSTKRGQVVGVIAGGSRALTRSIEGAEDDPAAGSQALQALKAGIHDAVVGIAASGGTPYVVGAMQQARQSGSLLISLACNHPSPMAALADIVIAPLVGSEVIAGSTRLKSGTAQKMVLNLLSTGVMIRLGKTYGNLMVDVKASNAKLQRRCQRIVELACGVDGEVAIDLLETCGGEVKTAIVAHRLQIKPEDARIRLRQGKGSIRQALQSQAS